MTISSHTSMLLISCASIVLGRKMGDFIRPFCLLSAMSKKSQYASFDLQFHGCSYNHFHIREPIPFSTLKQQLIVPMKKNKKLPASAFFSAVGSWASEVIFTYVVPCMVGLGFISHTRPFFLYFIFAGNYFSACVWKTKNSCVILKRKKW